MLETEAKTKWCPFARSAQWIDTDTRVVINREPGVDYRFPMQCRCLGSTCMAWQKMITPEHGYCGLAVRGVIREWDAAGRYVGWEQDGIDATWPDATQTDQIVHGDAASIPNLLAEKLDVWTKAIKPDREAEYRHIWISRAAHAFDSFVHPASDPVADAELAFKIADAFIAELRKRDGEGE